MHLFVILCVAALIYFIYKIENHHAWPLVKKNFNGPKVFPIFGTLYNHLFKDMYDSAAWITSQHKSYPSPMRMRNLNWPVLHIYKAEHAEVVFKSRTNITKPAFYNFLHPWFGNALLVSTGATWHAQRKMLTPTFHLDILKQFIPIFDEHARNFVRYFEERSEDNIDIRMPCTLQALDIIIETSFGRNLKCLTSGKGSVGEKYSRAIMYTAEHGLMERVAKPWLRSDTVFFKCSTTGQQVRKEIDYMHSFADQVIDEKIADRKENGGVSKTESIGNGKRLALLDMMMKMLDEGKLNKKEMREEVDMFMFAGHDTTATGLMWALYSFGYHDKKFQREVQAELDGVLDGHYEYEVTPEHLSQMETLERFIKESQRLYPAVPAIARMIDEPIIIDGKTVPTGTATTIFMTTLHRDFEQFPNPDEFDPARFLPEAVAKRHPFAFAPFSAGLRNCIGQRYSMMEMKMLLAHILYNFDLECTQTVDDLRPLMAIVYRPSNPMLIKFTRRQKRALSFV